MMQVTAPFVSANNLQTCFFVHVIIAHYLTLLHVSVVLSERPVNQL